MRVHYTVYGSWVYRQEGQRTYRLRRDGSIGGLVLVVEDGKLTGITPKVRHVGSNCPHADHVLALAEHLSTLGDVTLVDANQQARPHECFRTIPTVIAEVGGQVVHVHDVDAEADLYPSVTDPGGPLNPAALVEKCKGLHEAETAACERHDAECAAERRLVEKLASAEVTTVFGPTDLKTMARMLARALR